MGMLGQDGEIGQGPDGTTKSDLPFHRFINTSDDSDIRWVVEADSIKGQINTGSQESPVWETFIVFPAAQAGSRIELFSRDSDQDYRFIHGGSDDLVVEANTNTEDNPSWSEVIKLDNASEVFYSLLQEMRIKESSPRIRLLDTATDGEEYRVVSTVDANSNGVFVLQRNTGAESSPSWSDVVRFDPTGADALTTELATLIFNALDTANTDDYRLDLNNDRIVLQHTDDGGATSDVVRFDNVNDLVTILTSEFRLEEDTPFIRFNDTSSDSGSEQDARLVNEDGLIKWQVRDDTNGEWDSVAEWNVNDILDTSGTGDTTAFKLQHNSNGNVELRVRASTPSWVLEDTATNGETYRVVSKVNGNNNGVMLLQRFNSGTSQWDDVARFNDLGNVVQFLTGEAQIHGTSPTLELRDTSSGPSELSYRLVVDGDQLEVQSDEGGSFGAIARFDDVNDFITFLLPDIRIVGDTPSTRLRDTSTDDGNEEDTRIVNEDGHIKLQVNTGTTNNPTWSTITEFDAANVAGTRATPAITSGVPLSVTDTVVNPKREVDLGIRAQRGTILSIDNLARQYVFTGGANLLSHWHTAAASASKISDTADNDPWGVEITNGSAGTNTFVQTQQYLSSGTNFESNALYLRFIMRWSGEGSNALGDVTDDSGFGLGGNMDVSTSGIGWGFLLDTDADPNQIVFVNDDGGQSNGTLALTNFDETTFHSFEFLFDAENFWEFRIDGTVVDENQDTNVSNISSKNVTLNINSSVGATHAKFELQMADTNSSINRQDWNASVSGDNDSGSQGGNSGVNVTLSD